ncbi:MAG: hypothetical protein ABIH42_11420 [Planctomycetota bacterium]
MAPLSRVYNITIIPAFRDFANNILDPNNTAGPGNFIADDCISADPLFADISRGDYGLCGNSPCIDTGNNTHIPSDIEFDLAYNSRIMHGTIDIGCYEYPNEIVDATSDYIYPQDWYLEYYGMTVEDWEFIPEADLKKVSVNYNETADAYEFTFETNGNISDAFNMYGNFLGFQIYIDTDRNCVSNLIVNTIPALGQAVFTTSDFTEIGYGMMNISDTLMISVPASVIGHNFSWFASSGYACYPAAPLKTPLPNLIIPPISDMLHFTSLNNEMLIEWRMDTLAFPYPILFSMAGKSTSDVIGLPKTRDIGGPDWFGDWHLPQYDPITGKFEDIFKNGWRKETWVINTWFTVNRYFAWLVYQDKGNGEWDPAEPWWDLDEDGELDIGEWLDLNGNGFWDDAEEYEDQNGNGQWDTGEPLDDISNGKWDPDSETGAWIAVCRYDAGQNWETTDAPPGGTLKTITHTNKKPAVVKGDISEEECTIFEFDVEQEKLTIRKEKHKIYYKIGKSEIEILSTEEITGWDKLPKDPENVPRP